MKTRILLIEDNPRNRYLVTFLLQHRGYDVIEAGTGPEGLALAVEARPALILLDIQLPGMDGYAVARALRGDPRVAGIPVIAVTSYAMAGDRERCMDAGARGYIEKPINPDTFVDEMERFLP
jgi:CheY-like chemotaxis protein